MNRIVLFSLFLTTVNCQLAFIWLNQQQFQCVQNMNTRNYREYVSHQYLCISPRIWACIADINGYTRSLGLYLDHFCGFIDGQNVLQPHTVWNINIHTYPNI